MSHRGLAPGTPIARKRAVPPGWGGLQRHGPLPVTLIMPFALIEEKNG